MGKMNEFEPKFEDGLSGPPDIEGDMPGDCPPGPPVGVVALPRKLGEVVRGYRGGDGILTDCGRFERVFSLEEEEPR